MNNYFPYQGILSIKNSPAKSGSTTIAWGKDGSPTLWYVPPKTTGLFFYVARPLFKSDKFSNKEFVMKVRKITQICLILLLFNAIDYLIYHIS